MRGVSANVLTITRCTSTSPMLRGPPGRGSSYNPSTPCTRYRARHVPTLNLFNPDAQRSAHSNRPARTPTRSGDATPTPAPSWLTPSTHDPGRPAPSPPPATQAPSRTRSPPTYRFWAMAGSRCSWGFGSVRCLSLPLALVEGEPLRPMGALTISLSAMTRSWSAWRVRRSRRPAVEGTDNPRDVDGVVVDEA
jgi:hypothetical protein